MHWEFWEMGILGVATKIPKIPKLPDLPDPPNLKLKNTCDSTNSTSKMRFSMVFTI